MNAGEVWSILGIEETKDQDSIIAAYRAKVVSVNPEDDPEGFKRLREAFEEAEKGILKACCLVKEGDKLVFDEKLIDSDRSEALENLISTVLLNSEKNGKDEESYCFQG